MMNNNNGKRNFRRFGNKNNKNRHHRGGRFNSSAMDENNINPQQRRNFEMKRNTHLAKAKELLSAGERVDAEWHLQHADHFFRMANLGLENQRQFTPQTDSGLPPTELPTDAAPPADDLRFISDLPPAEAQGAAPQKPAAGTGLADLPFMQN
jgi:hypothetical protein